MSSTVACWSLGEAGSWCWDGDLWEIFAAWYYVELGGLLWTSVLKLALPPQRHGPDAWLEHQEPFVHTAGLRVLGGQLRVCPPHWDTLALLGICESCSPTATLMRDTFFFSLCLVRFHLLPGGHRAEASHPALPTGVPSVSEDHFKTAILEEDLSYSVPNLKQSSQ